MIFQNPFRILLKSEINKFIKITLLLFIVAIFEIFGIASIMPFFSMIANPNLINENKIFSKAYKIFEFSSVNNFIFFIGVVIILILIFSNSIKAYSVYKTNVFIGKLRSSIQKRLLDGYLNQPYDFFLFKNSSEISKIIWSDTDYVISNVITPVLSIISNSILLILIILLISIVNFKAALSIFFIISVFGLIFNLIFKNINDSPNIERSLASKNSFQVLSESIGGVKEIKVAQNERYFINMFSLHINKYAKLWSSSQTITQLPKFLLETIAFSLLIILTLILKHTYTDMSLILPILTLFAFAGYKTIPAIQIIYQGFASLKHAETAFSIIKTDLNLKNNNQSIESKFSPFNLNQIIKFSNIYYTYPGSTSKVLKNISLELKPNSTLGIVGGTGAGKTTFVDILLGLYRPDSGNIRIGDCNIDTFNNSSWKSLLGYVPQSIFLLDSTIAENIAFGVLKDEIDKENLFKAAKLASIHDFIINLPNGYDTVVGERGVRLSGGQRQRIGIARALYNSPKILILDEATSALDNLTESHIINALENLYGKCTIIIIAHRFSTIKKCDNIIIMENGEIIGHGTYSELINNNQDFQKLNMK